MKKRIRKTRATSLEQKKIQVYDAILERLLNTIDWTNEGKIAYAEWVDQLIAEVEDS